MKLLAVTAFSLVMGVFTSNRAIEAVEIVGHRGASYDAPENTLASVKLAWKRGADAVEIDVYLSKDGRIVAIHDETTKRTAGVDRKVVDQSFAQLRKLDAGTWKGRKWAGEKIPSLREVLATIPAGKRLFIEVKCGDEIIPPLKRDLKAAGKKPAQSAVIGFSYSTMRKVKRELPDLDVFWVVGLKRDKKTKRWTPGVDEIVRKTKAAKLQGAHLSSKPVIDRDYVSRFQDASLKLFVWTVNDPQEAKRVIAAGVDGITTDRPGYLKRRLSR